MERAPSAQVPSATTEMGGAFVLGDLSAASLVLDVASASLSSGAATIPGAEAGKADRPGSSPRHYQALLDDLRARLAAGKCSECGNPLSC